MIQGIFGVLLLLMEVRGSIDVTPTCITPSICELGSLALDFGDALKYNIFTSANFTNDDSNPSDVQGRVAVYGDHRVPLGHTIGDQLCHRLSDQSPSPDFDNASCYNLDPKCCIGYDDNVLIVRGCSYWPGGRLYYGNGCVGDKDKSRFGCFSKPCGVQSCVFGTCEILDGLTPNCSISSDCVPADSWWSTLIIKLEAISTKLYQLPVTDATFWQAQATPLSPSGHLDYSLSPFIWVDNLWLQSMAVGPNAMHVFEVDSTNLKQMSSFLWAPTVACAQSMDQTIISNCPTYYAPAVGEFIVINIRAPTDKQCQVENVDLERLKPYENYLIWNFGECDTVTFNNVAIYGMILAPRADLYASNGRVDGQIFVKNFYGSAQINWIQFQCQNTTTTTTTTTTTCTETCGNLFGCASNFNVFVFGDYYGSSDVEGRLAGKHVSFADGFSIADKLFTNTSYNMADWNKACIAQFGSVNKCDMCDLCGEAVVVGEASITSANSGRVYYGNWLSPDLSTLDLNCYSCPEYGTVYFYDAVLLNTSQCPNLATNLTTTFDNVKNFLINFSQQLCALSPTGTTSASYPSPPNVIDFLTVTFFGNPVREVANIDATELLNARMFDVTGLLNNDITVIFNVFGNPAGIENVDLSVLEAMGSKVLWNFCDASNLTINGVALLGTVLAPLANVTGGDGVIQGQLFANSFSGPTQSNWVPFNGCIETCVNTTNNTTNNTNTNTTNQCVVQDASPVESCKYSDCKSFWFGAAEKVDLSPNFQCNQPDGPASAIVCSFEEYIVDGKVLGKFVGTVCNDRKENYCLDIEIIFSKYHGPTEIANKTWNGINDCGEKAPCYDMCFDVCNNKCYGDDETCKNSEKKSRCKCVDNGVNWDYFEHAIGSFVAHTDSPWEGLAGTLKNHGCSTQRGYGANLFNLHFGLGSWLVAVIESAPYNKTSCGTLKVNEVYAADLNIDLDDCSDLKPGTICKSKQNHTKCNPECGAGDLSAFGTCINNELVRYTDSYTSKCIENLLKKYRGKCLCKPGYTGPNAFYWTDPSTGTTYVIADVCNTKCGTQNTKRGILQENNVCVSNNNPPNNGSCYVPKCTIEYSDGDNKNPWPSKNECYNFIGTVVLCCSSNIISCNWTTYFFVDNGIVIDQLWGDYVGDWNQYNNKVTCNGANWNQGSPPECITVYFKAHKPNPYSITCKDATEKNTDKKSCCFFVDYPPAKDNKLCHVDLNYSRKRTNPNTATTSTTNTCIAVSTSGCFSSSATNITDPGTNCGSLSQTTAATCPVCPDSTVSIFLSDNGQTLSDYVASLEKDLGLGENSIIVISATNTDLYHSSLEFYLTSNVAQTVDIESILSEKNYSYHVDGCTVLNNLVTVSNAQTYQSGILMTIVMIAFFLI